MARLIRITLLAITVMFAMVGVAVTVDYLGFLPSEPPPDEEYADALAPCVKPHAVWTADDFHKLLANCSPERLTILEQSLRLKGHAGTPVVRVAAIKNAFMQSSGNALAAPAKDVTTADYHKVVQRVARRHGVPDEAINRQPTFILERLVFEQLFKGMWNRLSIDQRRELLRKIDPGEQLDINALAAMAGAAILASPATADYFIGSAFYTTMSTVICSVAGFSGLTLPFSSYAGASADIAFISGPFDWTMLAIATAGNSVLLGRADVKDVTVFVIQMHCLKVAALKSSYMNVPDPPADTPQSDNTEEYSDDESAYCRNDTVPDTFSRTHAARFLPFGPSALKVWGMIRTRGDSWTARKQC